MQGIVDHALVGHFVGYTANAAIGVSWQIILVVITFIASLYTGTSVFVARYAGAGDADGVNRVVYQAFLASLLLGLGVLAPAGYLLAPHLLDLVHAAPEVKSRGPALPADHADLQRRPADLLHAGRRVPVRGRRADADDARHRGDDPQRRPSTSS